MTFFVSAGRLQRPVCPCRSGVDLRFGGIHALRGVSFDAAPSQITAVIGPNGADKTSVFNTISGFYEPAAGTMRLGDADISHVPVRARVALGLARPFHNIALSCGLWDEQA